MYLTKATSLVLALTTLSYAAPVTEVAKRQLDIGNLLESVGVDLNGASNNRSPNINFNNRNLDLSLFIQDFSSNYDFSKLDDRRLDDRKNFDKAFRKNNRNQVDISITEVDIAIVDSNNDFRRFGSRGDSSQEEVAIVVQETLIQVQEDNFWRDRFRRRRIGRRNRDVDVVIIVVQVIVIIDSHDDGNGRFHLGDGSSDGTDNKNKFLTLYAQSALTAKNGRDKTSTVMMTASSTLTITNATSALASLASEASLLSLTAGTGTDISAGTVTPLAATAIATDAPYPIVNATMPVAVGDVQPTWSVTVGDVGGMRSSETESAGAKETGKGEKKGKGTVRRA